MAANCSLPDRLLISSLVLPFSMPHTTFRTEHFRLLLHNVEIINLDQIKSKVQEV